MNANPVELTISDNPEIDFRTDVTQYKHWHLRLDGAVAYLLLNVDETGGLLPGYELKLNSYDLGVDIELYDATQRLRFEHPEVKTVVMTSGKDNIFCAGANIRMLGLASHHHKVNFCKFTNETRFAIEDACVHSHQYYIAALNGVTAGGGYELALTTDYIMLIDDSNSAVSLPEVPLLGVLPGTGGLTRLVDKRKVRRDRADVFCTTEEGVKGQKAVDWNLIDEIVPKSRFNEIVQGRAIEFAKKSDRPDSGVGITFTPLTKKNGNDAISYEFVSAKLDRTSHCATITIIGPSGDTPDDVQTVQSLGNNFWPLQLTRELDDLLLHLRFNEPSIGLFILESAGDLERVRYYDQFLWTNKNNWLVCEIILYWKRTLKRLETSARTNYALVQPGSCFAGFLAEILFAADRTYMFDNDAGNEINAIILSEFNFDLLPMGNGLSRLATRFLGQLELLKNAQSLTNKSIDAQSALDAGLVTDIFDDIDWDDEIRIVLEERSSFSADSLTGMEANLRFPGPETMETKIFGRLSAWQNWIFQRPNAVGEKGALSLYGSGTRPQFNQERV
ncbi:MAG: 2,3-epoxybenzoyl-CoA dihydrolase [Gammaproteobacteria bacterium]|nr:2,3-epoxybenzoyl-CoA dihydrolase [Gammaproteobacteria bacterium]